MFRAILSLIRRVRSSLEKRQYTPATMARYLRKQGAHVGEDCFIIPTTLGTEPYLVRIGNHVTIASGVQFVTHDGGAWIFRSEVPDLQVFGPIVIEDNCVIGMESLIFPNVRVGPNSIISAGSVVITDVPPDTIVMGVPARPIGSVHKYREKCVERWQAQRPADVELEPGESWWTSKHFARNRNKLQRHLTELFRDQLNATTKSPALGNPGRRSCS